MMAALRRFGIEKRLPGGKAGKKYDCEVNKKFIRTKSVHS